MSNVVEPVEEGVPVSLNVQAPTAIPILTNPLPSQLYLTQLKSHFALQSNPQPVGRPLQTSSLQPMRNSQLNTLWFLPLAGQLPVTVPQMITGEQGSKQEKPLGEPAPAAPVISSPTGPQLFRPPKPVAPGSKDPQPTTHKAVASNLTSPVPLSSEPAAFVSRPDIMRLDSILN
jgi:hypothetical protein